MPTPLTTLECRLILTKLQKSRIRKTEQFKKALGKVRVTMHQGVWEGVNTSFTNAVDISVGDSVRTRYFIRGKSLVATEFPNRFHAQGLTQTNDFNTILYMLDNLDELAAMGGIEVNPVLRNKARFVAAIRENVYLYLYDNFKDHGPEHDWYNFHDWLRDLKKPLDKSKTTE